MLHREVDLSHHGVRCRPAVDDELGVDLCRPDTPIGDGEPVPGQQFLKQRPR
jgi:hypothetical protein